MIHPLSDVSTTKVGAGTRIWQFVVILPDASIGEDCNICANCFIENDVVIGNRVTVKSGVQIYNGSIIGDDVFIGPNVTFTNDKYPRSRHYKDNLKCVFIRNGASVGANATILPGIEIGENSIVGAGSVVTMDIPANCIVAGNPAKIMRKIDENTIS